MKTSKQSNSPKVAKTYLGKFERTATRSQKAAVRQMAKRANRKPDLSKLFQSPLYQRLEQAIISDEFKAALQNHGLTSALEVASFKSYTALQQHVEEKARQSKTTLPQPSYRFYEQAKAEALKVRNLVRHTITVKDPVNQSLRHTTSGVSPTLERTLREGGENITYANPNSIQSEQSLAAYLKYIYELAKTDITRSDSLALDTRRPDLQNLELSEDNLKKEITTLELVNEVLLAQSKTRFDNSAENVFDALKTRFYPLALPFDLEKAQVRTALAQMGKQSLNELARRTQPDDYAIDNTTFTLVPNPADALNLLGDHTSAIWGNEIMLLSAQTTQGTLTTRDIYGGMCREDIVKVSNFCRLTDISFDELCQLFRQYGVKDDLGFPKNANICGASFFTEANKNLILEIPEPNTPIYSGSVKAIKITNAIGEYLQVGEVIATELVTGTNVASGAVATGSESYSTEDFTWGNAIDGNTDSCYHSATKSSDSYLLITLQAPSQLSTITIQGRKFTAQERDKYNLELLDVSNNVIYRVGGLDATQDPYTATVNLLYDGSDFILKYSDGAELGLPHLRSMNFMVRLYKRTSIPFHQLDWLLKIPGASEGPNILYYDDNAYRSVKDLGFDFIAHYLYYRQQFEVSVDEFVALLWRVNPFYRMDMEETSLLRQLFGDDAPMVRQKTLDAEITTSGADDETNKPFGDVLRRGLKLSKTEWDAIIAKVGSSNIINENMLGLLYRLSRFFRLLGWDVLKGLALAEKCSNNLLNDLIVGSNDGTVVSKILRAMDRLVSLSQWMKTAEFTPEALTRVLTPSAEVTQQLQCTEEVKSWLQELQKTVETHCIKETDFQPFTRWGADGTITIEAEVWFSQLQVKNILDNYGLVLNVGRTAIENAVKAILTEKAVPSGDQLIQPLVDLLVQVQESQQDDLAGQVAQMGDNVKTEVIAPMLLWMSTNPYAVLHTLLAWDYPDSSTKLGESVQLQLLYDLGRHLLAIASLSLGAIEVALVAEAPQIITPDPSSLLEQLFYLQRFKTWQNAQATADAWVTYLLLANPKPKVSPDDNLKAQLRVILALLLDCPEADIEIFLSGTVANTVQDVDYLARRIYLSQDLFLSATELNTVLGMNGNNPDAAAASGAILGGLYRYDDGSQEQSYRNALAEQVRDALVGIFLSDVVAADATLSRVITDTESLYEYLLLDVNVSSAVPTSRLVEACSSVQLYINRALEGVETGATFPNKSGLKQEWEIAQQYRIWEANQKLERYPANYIEPELRYKKSPIFQNFEAALGSGDINEDTVQTAIYSYIEELQRVAELTVCGFSKDEAPGESITFHFVARSNWEQEQYFYRRVIIYLQDERLNDPETYHKAFEWEPWQEIQISMTNPVISEMSVCKAWNRLFFFWLELEESQDTDGNKKLYYVRPKYLRTKMNGLMGDVLSPQMSDSTSTKLKLTAYPSEVNTFHPSFDGEIINLSYKIGSDKYSMTVSSKSAIFDVSTKVNALVQSVEGFRSISSADSSLTFGDFTFVAIPKTSQKSFSLTPFASRFYWAYGYMDVNLRQNMEVNVNYIPEGLYGSLQFQIPANTLFSGYVSLGSMGYPPPGSVKFADDNYIRLVVKITKGGTQLEGGNQSLSNIIPINAPFDFAYYYGFDKDTLASSWKFPLPENCWDPNDEGALSLEIELYFEFNYTAIGYADGSYPPFYSFDAHKETAHQSFNFTLTAQKPDSLPKALAFSEEEELGCESYLYFSQDANSSPSDSYVSLLYSEAMGELARSFPIPEGQSLLSYLFTPDNQLRTEGNVDDFYQELYEDLETSSTNNCQPETNFHFDGSFGIYGWEVFYHIPSLVASKYIEQGDYEGAKRWFNAIYDLSTTPSWNVLPLRAGLDQSGVDHTGGITDPDEIALDNPVYYQQATIRQYLEMLLAAGDDAYRQETQETLQQAKMFYVTAKHLFGAELGQELETLTASDWHNPTLGAVTAANFRPPYNQEIRKLHQTVEERLDNLRHWLSIDGERLNIPLLAPPINPRQLQLAAQSSRAGTEPREASQPACPYSFDEILTKAQGYVKNLQTMSVRLQNALEKKDDRELARIIQEEKLGDYPSLIELQKLKLEMAKKAKQIADAQLEQAIVQLAGETSSLDFITSGVIFAIEKSRLALKKTLLKTQKTTCELSTAISAAIPKIAGLSFGGMSPETGFIGKLIGTIIEQQEYQENKADLKTKEEVYQERMTKTFRIAGLTGELTEASFGVEQAELAIEQEKKCLEDLEGQQGSDEKIMQFMSNCLTNTEFYGWYIGQMSSLYKASYDATLSFCRLAERVFQEETGITSTFVRPNWNSNYQGLLAPDSLALDLERMDLAYTQYLINSAGTASQSFSLSSQRTIDSQTTVLQSLLERGEAVFELTEEMFDEYYPDQYDRRIENIRVIFPDLHGIGKAPHGRLTQLSNCRYYSQERAQSKAKTLKNVLAYQSMSLSAAETDTRTQIQPSRRLRTFQGTGVHSTWHLSIPSVVKAIQNKRAEIPHHTMLKANLSDIILEVSYTAKW